MRRRNTSSKVDIPDGAQKEIEFLFLHDVCCILIYTAIEVCRESTTNRTPSCISKHLTPLNIIQTFICTIKGLGSSVNHNNVVSKVEKYKIPPALIINFDQTPLKYVPVGNETLAKKGAQSVTIDGSSDKRTITGTFGISLTRDFLPMQLIYRGKTIQCLPKYKFPKHFCLSFNQKHFSNTTESLKYLKEVIVPYVTNQCNLLNLPNDQKALVIMDVFTGQMTSAVMGAYEEANICIVNVPPNMTIYYQPLDLTVNGYAKRYLKSRFHEWYSSQVKQQLDDGVNIEDVQVTLQLTKLKPIHAAWVVDLFNHMTTDIGKEIIESGWRAAGILDALKLGLEKLPSVDPFSDIAPMLNDDDQSNEVTLLALCDVTAEEFVALGGPAHHSHHLTNVLYMPIYLPSYLHV